MPSKTPCGVQLDVRGRGRGGAGASIAPDVAIPSVSSKWRRRDRAPRGLNWCRPRRATTHTRVPLIMPVTRPDGPSARDLDTSDRAGSACEARAGAMSLSDDFAKVQLQAAAATKELSQQPRLGAVPRRGGTRFCSFLASSARTKGRALPGDASTDPFLSNIPRRVPNGDGRERSSGHPGQGQGETAAELRARSPSQPHLPRAASPIRRI